LCGCVAKHRGKVTRGIRDEGKEYHRNNITRIRAERGGGKDGRRVGLWVRVKARNLWVWIFRVAGKHGTAPGTVE